MWHGGMNEPLETLHTSVIDSDGTFAYVKFTDVSGLSSVGNEDTFQAGNVKESLLSFFFRSILAPALRLIEPRGRSRNASRPVPVDELSS